MDTRPPLPFEVSGFDPRYHDTLGDALGDLDLFGIEGLHTQPFSLGRVDGVPAGIKLVGETGGWRVGLLGVQDQARPGPALGADLRNGFVARVTRRLFEAAHLGFIFTSGDPESGTQARTVGVDLQVRARGGLVGTVWVQETDNEVTVPGDDRAWGLLLRYPDSTHDVEFRHAHTGAAFDPVLGQVNRRGADDTRLRYRLSGALLGTDRWSLAHRLEAQQVRSTEDEEASGHLTLALLEGQSVGGERLEGFVSGHREVLVKGFDLAERLTVAPGEYTYTRYGVNLSTSRFDRWLLGIQIARGDYLQGQRQDWRVTSAWQAADWLQLDAAFTVREHRQPSGAFTAKTLTVNSEMSLLPGWSLSPGVQFNNVNEELGLKARLTWRAGPGRELLLDWNRTVLRNLEDRLVAPLQDSVLRGSYRLRF
ncbi:MAG: hypothetical protein V2I57_06525 [Xanthomonadales bacterium]|jgi:hypothetical protein|nr:hypothetical protein [Xanthomonadales bacterium]